MSAVSEYTLARRTTWGGLFVIAVSVLQLAATDKRSPAHRHPQDRLATACGSVAEQVATTWRRTGPWRWYSPYPAFSEIAATDSVGFWLERSLASNGELQVRRISIAQTEVATIEPGTCDVALRVFRRQFAPIDSSQLFSDGDLRALLDTSRAGMIYVWSRHMALSLAALAAARAAAAELGVAFVPIEADRADDMEVEAVLDSRQLASLDLLYRNATIHAPSVLFYARGQMLGLAIPGAKSRSAYVAYGRSRMNGQRSVDLQESLPALRVWLDRDARVDTVRTVVTHRPVGFFFQPIAGRDMVVFASPNPYSATANRSYILELGSGREHVVPGNIDPVPTPDGRYIMRPGLLFHRVEALLVGDTTVVSRDPEMPDQYQTASLIEQAKTETRYRVVTGWDAALRLRTYVESAGDAHGAARITPTSAVITPCPGRVLMLPMSARTGSMVSAYDTVTASNHILDIHDDGGCTDIFDVGFPTGKLAFSYDGDAVAFATSRVQVDAEGLKLGIDDLVYKDAFVLFMRSGRLIHLAANRGVEGASFPTFLTTGHIIQLDQGSRTRPTYFREFVIH